MLFILILLLIISTSFILSILKIKQLKNYQDSCPTGQSCREPCPASKSCPIGQSCREPCPKSKSCPTGQSCRGPCPDCPGDLPVITKCPNSSSKPLKLIRNWNGTDLIPQNNKGWQYLLGPDPTHGLVKYTAGTLDNSFKNSTKDNLNIRLVNNPGNFISSIRLNTVETFDYGLFIFDVKQIPFGQFIWSSIWLNGMISGKDSWPANGEIDVIEGGWQKGGAINAQNTVSFHTEPGCKAQNLILNDNTGNCNLCDYPPGSNPSCSDIPKHHTCGKNTQNLCAFMGCSKVWPPISSNAYGKKFSDNGGGIYAVNLTCDGKIKLWFVSASEDNYNTIKTSSSLTPDKLDSLCKPENILDAKTVGCNNSFRDLQITINTTICGDAFTGGSLRDTCNSGVVYSNMNNPTFIENSKWSINSIKVYQ